MKRTPLRQTFLSYVERRQALQFLMRRKANVATCQLLATLPNGHPGVCSFKCSKALKHYKNKELGENMTE